MSFLCTHLHFREDFVKELHALHIIYRQELIIFLLGNLVREYIAIDDSGHLVFTLNYLSVSIFETFHSNVTDFRGSSMFTTSSPLLA